MCRSSICFLYYPTMGSLKEEVGAIEWDSSNRPTMLLRLRKFVEATTGEYKKLTAIQPDAFNIIAITFPISSIAEGSVYLAKSYSFFAFLYVLTKRITLLRLPHFHSIHYDRNFFQLGGRHDIILLFCIVTSYLFNLPN